MRRQPQRFLSRPRDFGARPGRRDADKASDRVVPFIVSGGDPEFYLAEAPVLYDPQSEGVQLCASVYVPVGMLGILKSVCCFPYLPPEFSTDPVRNSLLRYRAVDANPFEPRRPAATDGVWTTPIGWESFHNSLNPAHEPPTWEWSLRMFPGSIDELRSHASNIAAFSYADPNSWFMVPDIAVPRLPMYNSGLPGSAVGFPLSGQRMQVLPNEALRVHIPIPENHTLCLFASWTQTSIEVLTRSASGGLDAVTTTEIYPLGPSAGRLTGFSIPTGSEAANRIVHEGW